MEQSCVIGIDVGGSSLKCGLIDHSGKILDCFLQPLDGAETEQAVIKYMVNAIQQCAQQTEQAISYVGIGFPGIVDNNVIIGGADNLPGFENLPLGDILKQETGYDVLIDNDANMMGYGELAYGAGKGCTDIVFITVGTGIGGAVVINGQLHGGFKNRGAELGHIILQHNGTPCTCGAKGCFEVYASVTALVNNYRELTAHKQLAVDGKVIVDKYIQHDAHAILAMHNHFDYMATGIASLVNIFSPQKIVIGGGISEAGAFYIQEISKRVQHTAMPATMQHTTLVSASLGNRAGMLGCAAKALEKVEKDNIIRKEHIIIKA